MKYLVQEFTAGKWFNTRSFDNEADAVDWSKRYRISRVVKI